MKRVAVWVRVLQVCALASCVFFLGACGGSSSQEPFPTLSEIQVTATISQLPLGATSQLSATGVYSDASQEALSANAVTWSSDDETIVTVSAAGVISSHSQGVVTVFATMGGVTGNFSVTVVAPALLSIWISAPLVTMVANTTLQLEATGFYSNASVQDLTHQVVWSAANSTVASVGVTGLVTAENAGVVQITASLGAISSENTVALTVSALTINSVSISPAVGEIVKGASLQLSAMAHFNDGSSQLVTSLAVWGSSDETAVLVSTSGIVQGVNAGSATITATIGGVSGAASMTVTPATLVSIQLDPVSPSVAKGYALQLSAIGIYSDNSNHDLSNVVLWESANTAVALISNGTGNQGNLIAQEAGTATVQASYQGVVGSTQVIVTNAELVRLEVAPINFSMEVGGDKAFVATAVYSDGSSANVTSEAAWVSSNVNVVLIGNASSDRGIVSAIGVGTVIITANYRGRSTSVSFNVTAATLNSIEVSPAEVVIPVGASQLFTATGHYNNGSTRDITAEVLWQSSNDTVAGPVGIAGRFFGVASSNQPVQISASMHGKIGFTTLEVTAATLTSINIEATSATANVIANGTEQSYKAVATYSDASTQDVTSQVTWISSDNTIVVIRNLSGSKGVALGVAPGSALISANIGSVVSNSITLDVTAATLSGIMLQGPAQTIYVGQQVQVRAIANYSDSSTQDITKSVVWSSLNTSVAIASNGVGAEGMITVLAAGNTQIKAVHSGIEATLSMLTVNDPNIAASISMTATPNVISNANGTDVSTIDLIVGPLGVGGNTLGILVDIEVFTASGQAIYSGTQSAGAGGVLSYSLTSGSQLSVGVNGFVLIRATVQGTSITKTVAVLSTSNFSSVIQRGGGSRFIYSNGTYLKDSLVLTYMRNLSNRNFNIAGFSMYNGAFGQSQLLLSVAAGGSGLANGNDILSEGESAGYLVSFPADVPEHSAVDGIQTGYIFNDPVQSDGFFGFSVRFLP